MDFGCVVLKIAMVLVPLRNIFGERIGYFENIGLKESLFQKFFTLSHG